MSVNRLNMLTLERLCWAVCICANEEWVQMAFGIMAAIMMLGNWYTKGKD